MAVIIRKLHRDCKYDWKIQILAYSQPTTLFNTISSQCVTQCHSAPLIYYFTFLHQCGHFQQTEHSLKPPHAGVLNGLKLSLQSSINTELKALNFRAQQANEKPSLLWACSASQPQQRASKSTALNEKQPPTFGHQWKEKKKATKTWKLELPDLTW